MSQRTGSGAGQRIRHGPAVAEARGVALVLVDAELLLDLREDLVDEGDVGAAGVGPPAFSPFGATKTADSPASARRP